MLGTEAQHRTWDAACYGMAPAGLTVSKGEALFPRIDVKAELALLEQQRTQAQKPEQAEKPAAKPEGVVSMIEIGDFAKIDLRVAQITACEPVPKADKLLCLTLDDGGEGRQVVSGIAAWYRPEDLVGKKIVVVANLKPAKLRGVVSQGMILAADAGERVQVLFVDQSVPAGSKVR